jgi:hypothetical protein
LKCPLKGPRVARILHGFSRGSILSAETQQVFFRLKVRNLVATYSVNCTNTGETIVLLASAGLLLSRIRLGRWTPKTGGSEPCQTNGRSLCMNQLP